MYDKQSALKELDFLFDLLDHFEKAGLPVTDLKKRIEREKWNREVSSTIAESSVLKASIRRFQHQVQKELLYTIQDKLKEKRKPEQPFSTKIKQLLERMQKEENTIYKNSPMRLFLNEYMQTINPSNSSLLLVVSNALIKTSLKETLKTPPPVQELGQTPLRNDAPPLTALLDNFKDIIAKIPKLTLNLNDFSNDTSVTKNYKQLQYYQEKIKTHIKIINQAIYHYALLCQREKTPEELKEYLHFIESTSYGYKPIPEIIEILNNQIEIAIAEINNMIKNGIELETTLNKQIEELKSQPKPPPLLDKVIDTMMMPLTYLLNRPSDNVSSDPFLLLDHKDNQLSSKLIEYGQLKKEDSDISQLAQFLPRSELSVLMPLNKLVYEKEQLCRTFEENIKKLQNAYYDLESDRIKEKTQQTDAVISKLTQINERIRQEKTQQTNVINSKLMQINERIRQEKEQSQTLIHTRSETIEHINQSVQEMKQLKQALSNPLSSDFPTIDEGITLSENLIEGIKAQSLEQIKKSLNLHQTIIGNVEKAVINEYENQLKTLKLDLSEQQTILSLNTEQTQGNYHLKNVLDNINAVNTQLVLFSNARKQSVLLLKAQESQAFSQEFNLNFQQIKQDYIDLKINTTTFKEKTKKVIKAEIKRLRTETKPDNLLIAILRKLLTGIQNIRETEDKRTRIYRPHFFLPTPEEKQAAERITALKKAKKTL